MPRSKRPITPLVTSPSVILTREVNGGKLRVGNPGNRGGKGRPKEEIREKLRDLAFGKGIPFLKETMQGNVRVRFVGTCPHCHQESEPDEKTLEKLEEYVGTTVEHRLKANDQALKFGVGTQNESLDLEEGKALVQKVIGGMVDALTAHGVPLSVSKACYEEALGKL